MFGSDKKERPRARTDARPLVSCILATLDRPQFFRQALRYYLRQTYTKTELIVVDDGKQSVEHLCQGLPDVRYIRCPEPAMLGTKLNIGIQQARGDVIQKLDDDDYYAPVFLEQAVGALMGTAPGTAVVAWCCFLVLLPGEPMPRYSGHGWAAGPTMCFDRELWARSPFRDIPRAVDEKFMEDAKVEIVRVCRPESLILVRHGRRHTWNSMSDQTPVEDFFHRQPEYPTPILDVVEPIDASFYRPILGLPDAPKCG
jgi:glycosyltransferase involved in cell wall biosynthesis